MRDEAISKSHDGRFAASQKPLAMTQEMISSSSPSFRLPPSRGEREGAETLVGQICKFALHLRHNRNHHRAAMGVLIQVMTQHVFEFRAERGAASALFERA